jgi:hypothetical protein
LYSRAGSDASSADPAGWLVAPAAPVPAADAVRWLDDVIAKRATADKKAARLIPDIRWDDDMIDLRHI